MKQSGSRTREIISVLRKHHIGEGITPEKLRLILEDLGPTFIKLGQIASTHPDILPQAYCEELSKLCSDVVPMPFDDVIEIIEESCGCPWSHVFSWICETPQGSASIAQVHKGILCTGEQVVIKVQRRGIYEKMAQDIRLLHRLIRFIPSGAIKNMVDLDQVLDDIWATSKEEMDFVMEAANMQEFARRNNDISYIGTPRLYAEYTSPHMLVMEYIGGYAIDDKTALLENGYDLKEIAEKLADNYLQQILYEGFFHADPHTGNIRVRDGKIIWIDMGMMGRLSENDRKMLFLGLQGIALDDIDRIEEAVMALGEFKEKPDRQKLRDDIERLLNKYGRTGMGNLKLTELIQDLMNVMREDRIKMPHNLTLFLRGLTHMEGILADLSPDINMIGIARSKIMENLRSKDTIEAELKNSGKNILLSLNKAQDIPSSLSDVLRKFRNGEARMTFDIHATDQFSRLLQDLTFTLVECLLAVALFIGSSIVCTTDLRPRLWGMPAVAAAGYVLAILLTVHMAIAHFRKKK